MLVKYIIIKSSGSWNSRRSYQVYAKINGMSVSIGLKVTKGIVIAGSVIESMMLVTVH